MVILWPPVSSRSFSFNKPIAYCAANVFLPCLEGVDKVQHIGSVCASLPEVPG